MFDYRSKRIWLFFLFGINFDVSLNANAATAWNTGMGTSATRCSRLEEVIRHEPRAFKWFFGLLVTIALCLNFAIRPQHVYDLEYVLAILYIPYVIGVLVLIYQAVRDCDFSETIELRMPYYQCVHCRRSNPVEDLITFECVPGDRSRSHIYHETCLLANYARGVPNICPGCGVYRPVAGRTYGHLEPNVLDNSRLMWYINSLFSRRIPILVRRFRYPVREGYGPTPSMRDRASLQALTMVIIVHMLMMTCIIMFFYLVHQIAILPLPLLCRVRLILYAILVLKFAPRVWASWYRGAYFEDPRMHTTSVIDSLATPINRIFSPFVSLRDRGDFSLRQFQTLTSFVRKMVSDTIVLILVFGVIVPVTLTLLIVGGDIFGHLLTALWPSHSFYLFILILRMSWSCFVLITPLTFGKPKSTWMIS